MASPSRANIYDRIIEGIFFDQFRSGTTEFEFSREDITKKAVELGFDPPKNLGDVVYSVRYRRAMPDSIIKTQSENLEWIIEGAGRASYRFKLVPVTKILPRPDLVSIEIPDATPEVIRAYQLDDEQALLAIVRYNRLIDTFLGLTTYSLQNHLRTTVRGIGQIEIDELYVGIDRHGCHFIIPVQAKGGKDQIGVVQTTQDIRFVEQRFPGLRPRAISVQFMDSGTVAIFELTIQDNAVKVLEERHYSLVPASSLDGDRVKSYRD